MLRLTLALLACLCFGPSPTSAASGPVITEFLAQNDGGLRDAEGDTPDWIEIRNESSAPVDLAGWRLTDSPTNLTKWTFPSTNLPVGGFLIVFASGKDRAVMGQELHTNFRLDEMGGFLALVQPDDATLSSSFTYGPQRANVSFGAGQQVATSAALIANGAAARIFIPSNGALGLSWTESAFDDSAWFGTNTPISFTLGVTAATVLAIDFNERGLNAGTNTQPGFQSFVIHSNVNATALQTQATTRVFGGISVTLSNTAPLGYDDRQRTTPGNSGSFTEALLLRDFVFSRDDTGNGGLDVTIEGLNPNAAYRLTVWSFDSGSPGARVSDWFANGAMATNNYTFDGGTLPTANSQYRFAFDTVADSNGSIVLSGRRDLSSATFGVFLNALQISTLSFSSATSGLASLMFSNRASAYVRQTFTVTNPAVVSELNLRIRYDDGFAAYLNGQLVAARNAPTSPGWDSVATASHAGLTAEDVIIVPPPGLIVAGQNLLAIHGLNLHTLDPDFTLGPTLFSQQITPFGDRYFKPPTPGAANTAGFSGLVSDTKFSVNRGFYDGPISLVITTATEGTQIRYTLDGSAPTTNSGIIHATPITITNTAIVRAAAFKPGWVPSDVDTHTYLYLASVLRQATNPPGYPATWQASYPADYGMDPNVVNHPKYGLTISNDLRSIPTLSIVSAQNGLWNSSTGIYPNATLSGINWERAASIELIAGNGATEFAVTCKLEMHGNASRDNVRTPKHSMHVGFNSDYGPTKLRYDWFGGGVDEHDKIIFRSCGFVDGWAGRYADNGTYTSAETGEMFRGLRYRPENTCYLRDAWVKDSFRDMGWAASRTEYVHLYLNGLYWGLYQPSEALNASYFASHLGGDEGAWDVIVGEDNNGPPIIVDGSGADWTNVLNLVNAGITTEAAYATITNLVDIDNLIDYMMLHIFAESEDWPRHNWYVAHRRATNGVPGTKFVCSVWDQELTLDRLVRRNRIDVGGATGEVYSPARVYQQLRAWPEFRRQFGDRVHKHLFNEGTLTPSNNISRLLAPAAVIRNALVGESARWGDAREFPTPSNPIGTGQTFTRDEWWQPEIDKYVTNFFLKLTADNVTRFRAGSLYPNISAPQFNQFGGAVSNGFELLITQTNAGATIFYTVDGRDPREYGSGAVAGSALAYSLPIALNSPALVRARVRSGANWSALVEALFLPPQDLSRLVVTEIMYNPVASGPTDGEEFEFVELKNSGTNTLNLTGLRFAAGINYTFPLGSTLAPGQFWLLVRNTNAFAARYPEVAWRGIYSGRLANEGEIVTLALPFGGKLFSVDYRDTTPWPLAADSYGFSLVPRLTNPLGNSDNGADWRASSLAGGSPGADDPTPVVPSVFVNELLANTTMPAVDAVELFNPNPVAVNIGGWFLTDDADVPQKYRIPEDTMIPAGGFAVFTEAHFNSTPGTNSSFAFSSHGESVFLFSADTKANLTGYSHGFEFGGSDLGVSFGRHVNSVGEEDFVAQTAVTLGAANASPRLGPVVISEIHYHPESPKPEFIELVNLGETPVSLFDPATPVNPWRLNGLGYAFPTNVTLPAGGVLLLAPTNETAFRAQYSVPANVLFLQYGGQLQNSGERLELQRAGPPDTNGVPYVSVDMIRYNDRAPWPPAADGSGPSLQRVPPGRYGNDPAHWMASTPTPGTVPSEPDTDGDGLPDAWEIANGTDPNAPDAGADPDNDGQTNGDEYLAGTSPINPASRLKIETATIHGTEVHLEFLAVSNRTYRVLFKDALDVSAWTKLIDVPASPATRIEIVPDTLPANGTRFYRLVTPAAP